MELQKRYDQEVNLGGRPTTSLTEIKMTLRRGEAVKLDLLGSGMSVADARALKLHVAPDGPQLLCGDRIDLANGILTGAPFSDLKLTPADATLIRSCCMDSGVRQLTFELGHSLPLKALAADVPPLSSCQLVSVDMPLLCALMSLDVSVTALDLPANQIGDAGAATLADMLRRGGLPILTRLNLVANNIGDQALEEIAAAAMEGALPKLVDLHLGSNPSISSAGADALGRGGGFRALQMLELSNCSIDSRGLDALTRHFAAGAMPALRGILLSQNRVGDAALLAFVEVLRSGSLPELRRVNLTANPISSAAAAEAKAAMADRPAINLQLPDPRQPGSGAYGTLGWMYHNSLPQISSLTTVCTGGCTGRSMLDLLQIGPIATKALLGSLVMERGAR